jgi:hypothetical protein
MADRLILLSRGDEQRSRQIIDAFQERTGLSAQQEDDRAVFELSPDDHRIEVVQTLTEIDPEWGQHVALGDPGAEPTSG